MFSGQFFRHGTGHRARALSVLAGTFLGTLALAASGAAFAQCTGSGGAGQGVALAMPDRDPGSRNPLASFDISWVNPNRAEYYLADRSNRAIDIVDTSTNKFKTQIKGFVGAKLGNPDANTLHHHPSGPDGVVSFGKWLYAGDGNSTLKVIDLDKARSCSRFRPGVVPRRRDGAHRHHVEWPATAACRQQRRRSTFRHLVPGERQQLQQLHQHPHQDNRRSVDDAARSGPVDGAAVMGSPSKRFYVSIPQYQLSCGLHTEPRCDIGPRRCCHLPGRAVGDRPERGYGAALHAVGNIPSLGSVCQYTYGAYDRSNNIGVLALPTCTSQRRRCRPRDRLIGQICCWVAPRPTMQTTRVHWCTRLRRPISRRSVTSPARTRCGTSLPDLPRQRRPLLYGIERQPRAIRRAVARYH